MPAELASHRSGRGPRVVLLHGFTQTSSSWGAVAADLATDHEVLRVDAPGHGGSAAVRADLDEAAADLVHTGGTATYVGYSMGGRIALHTAIASPDSLEALVLVSAGAGLRTEEERAARRASDEALATRIETRGVRDFVEAWLDQPLFAGLPEPGRQVEDRCTNTVDGLASSLRLAGLGTQRPLWDLLGGITCPALVVAGAADEKFASLAGEIAEGIGDNATLAVLEGAGHTVHLEQPERFLAVLRTFLGTLRRR